ncbi:MAG: hypothetical protein U0Q18_07330 [Bryobacteraceae bacterium]
MRLAAAALVLTGCSIAGEPATVTDLPLEGFSKSGSTAELVKDLARAIALRGLIGFENVGDTGPSISIRASDITSGAILQEISSQDHRYRLLDTGHSTIVNLVAVDASTPGHGILELRLSRVDVDLEDWPENVISSLPYFAPDLLQYLNLVFIREGGVEDQGGSPGAGMRINLTPPHFRLHLTNVTVREALNAIAAQSFDLYRANGHDPRFFSKPPTVAFYPAGWEFRYRSPKGMSFERWWRGMFNSLE